MDPKISVIMRLQCINIYFLPLGVENIYIKNMYISIAS